MVILRLLFVALAGWPTAAHAQQIESPPCFPPCRSGFSCRTGECVSACETACRPGMVCAPDGECVSACNPACAPDQTCTGSGECISATGWNGSTAVISTGVSSPSPPRLVSPGPERAPILVRVAPEPGWSRGAATFGFVSAGLTMALTFAVVANNAPSTAETARTIGALAIVNLGVGAPITAVGASSARRYPAVVGSPGLRITSWVGYGLALLDAVILLNLSWDHEIDSGQIVSVGLLGALSTAGFAADALISGRQAESLRSQGGYAPAGSTATGTRLAIVPVRSRYGDVIPTVGWCGSF